MARPTRYALLLRMPLQEMDRVALLVQSMHVLRSGRAGIVAELYEESDRLALVGLHVTNGEPDAAQLRRWLRALVGGIANIERAVTVLSGTEPPRTVRAWLRVSRLTYGKEEGADLPVDVHDEEQVVLIGTFDDAIAAAWLDGIASMRKGVAETLPTDAARIHLRTWTVDRRGGLE